MKHLVFISLFFASAALAGDSTSVRWTSDTTYVRGGVEHWDPIESYYNEVQRKMEADPELELDYNYFWNYEAPRLKRPDLDDQKEDSIA